MNGSAYAATRRLTTLRAECAKLPAFARRDFLNAWSYRALFISDLGSMVIQLITFYFVGELVDPDTLPEYGGKEPSYVEFVAIGIAVNVFLTIGLGRVAGALRTEQFAGTLEALLMTPTALGTIQAGSAVYSMVSIPIRTLIFLVTVVVAFGLDIYWDGLGPMAVILIFFIPFVWGIGLAAAGSVLTFRGGHLGVSIFTTLMTLGSGAYFPVELLPSWAESLTEINPLAMAIEGVRDALLGGTGWAGVGETVAVLAPASVVTLAIGAFSFRWAFQRELRRGTLSLY